MPQLVTVRLELSRVALVIIQGLLSNIHVRLAEGVVHTQVRVSASTSINEIVVASIELPSWNRVNLLNPFSLY